MLLTNQKIINYENLYKIEGNHSSYFLMAKIVSIVALLQIFFLL